MAGASPSEAGQASASPAGWTEEEERRKEVQNLSAALHMQSPAQQATDLVKSEEQYGDSLSAACWSATRSLHNLHSQV